MTFFRTGFPIFQKFPYPLPLILTLFDHGTDARTQFCNPDAEVSQSFADFVNTSVDF